MALQIVLIESQITVAVNVKQALEQQRLYEVFPFSGAEAALDFVRENTVDYIVVDMQLSDYPPPQLISQLHNIQPDASIIASTSDSTAAGKAIAAGAVGLIDAQYNGRKVLDVLDKLASDRTTNQPKSDTPSRRKKPKPSTSVFDRLAAEEPPMPGIVQGGTITTYMARVTDEELNNLLASINAVMEVPDEDVLLEPPDEDDEDTPAQFIIEDMLDETLPLEYKPFEEYINRLRNDPDTRRYTREPAFLEDADDEIDVDEDNDSPDDTPAASLDATQPATGTQSPAKKDDKPKERPKPPPPPTLPPENDPSFMQNSSARIDVWDWGDEPKPEPEESPQDAQIAQMAVSLTQASLESTAQATLLTEGETVVAYEGTLSDEDINEIVAAIADQGTDVSTGQARVRFITLSSNGLDYLIFSRRTESDYLLSMVFEGQTSMTEIRQQAKRILQALNNVPKDDAPVAFTEDAPSRGGLRLETDPDDDVDVGPRTRYTFLWLPRDPRRTLAYATTEAINAGLRVQLVERGWHVDLLEVQEDYVYIVAGIPGDEPPQSLVRNLQQRAARIAAAQNPDLNPDTLWAESYFVLSPGRELNVQEIQQYINFYRV